MFVAVRAENVHHVLLVRSVGVPHFAGLAVGVALDGLEHLAPAADLENAAYFVQRLLVQTAQRPRSLPHVDGREAAEEVAVVPVDPLPDGSLFGVQFGFDKPRHDAVTRAQDVVADGAFECQLLAPLFALDKEPEPLRKGPQGLDDISGRVAARTARTARHALAAVPDRVALHQRLDGIVVACLYRGDDLPRVVVVELGRGTDSGADAAVHAGVQPLAAPHVLHQHIEILSHLQFSR